MRRRSTRYCCSTAIRGEILNDMLWPLARFLVRYVWRSLELVGVLDPTRAGRSHRVKDRIENRLDTYAREHNQLLISIQEAVSIPDALPVLR